MQRRAGHLRLPRVVVGLDEDLPQSDVFAHGHQRLLHGLSGPQDGHARDLQAQQRWDIFFFFYRGRCTRRASSSLRPQEGDGGAGKRGETHPLTAEPLAVVDAPLRRLHGHRLHTS